MAAKIEPRYVSLRSGLVMLHRDALLGDAGLDEELHIGRDRRADRADQQQQVRALELDRWNEAVRHVKPVGMRENRGDGVGEESEGHHEEDFFDAIVRATRDDEPDTNRGQRHGNVLGNAEQLTGGGDASEFGDSDEDIGDEQRRHGEGGATHAEALADEVGEALAGRRAHTRAHLLHDREADSDNDQHPEQRVTVLRADARPRGDSARVVAGVGGD